MKGRRGISHSLVLNNNCLNVLLDLSIQFFAMRDKIQSIDHYVTCRNEVVIRLLWRPIKGNKTITDILGNVATGSFGLFLLLFRTSLILKVMIP